MEYLIIHTGIWYIMIRPFTLATLITDLQKCSFVFWSTTIQISPKRATNNGYACDHVWRFTPNFKALLCEESSYLMVKLKKRGSYHQNVGRKRGTDLPVASILRCSYLGTERLGGPPQFPAYPMLEAVPSPDVALFFCRLHIQSDSSRTNSAL